MTLAESTTNLLDDASTRFDIVILSNGPGEVSTWVKPVVQAIKAQAPHSRISVLLSPCPHASGQEPTVLASYPEIDRIQSADHFFKFLLTGNTIDSWDWHPQGVVVFLGGDQFYTVLVAKRLGYRSVTYAEWAARWPGLIDRFGVTQDAAVAKAPQQHQSKFTVVGDLMADVQTSTSREEITAIIGCDADSEIVGLLPGSKPIKLKMALPTLLATVALGHAERPQTQYVIGVAPTLTLQDLASYADPAVNPGVEVVRSPQVELIESPKTGLPYLQVKDDSGVDNGPKIFLWQRFPALDMFSQCALCITSPGANTAQLGAIATPMIVLTSVQGLDVLALADGWPSLLAKIPGLNTLTRKFINPLIIRIIQKSGRLFAWPNIWAGREVVPEAFGIITPEATKDTVLSYLTHPEKLEQMSQELQTLCGSSNAADKMASLILETVNYPK